MILQAIDIRKSFGTTEILRGISLGLEQSEIVSLVGPSGAGKTTLLNILGTLSLPTSGNVLFDKVDITKLSGRHLSNFRARNIGFVFQQHNLLTEFSAVENVAIAAIIAGSSKAEAERKARKILSHMGLSHRLDCKPSTLSGGEAQRVAVARALINRPRVVFADEPSGSLDSTGREQLHSLFFSLREEFGQTFLIVTHDDTLAAKSDRKLVIKDGVIA